MRRGHFIVAGVLLGAMGALAAVGLAWPQPTPSVAVSVSLATAEVMRGPLRDTKTITGTLSYGVLTTLRAHVTGEAMLTWIAPEGATIARGEALYRFDGLPVVLFYGSVPLYRTLRFEPGGNAPVWVEREQASAALAAATLALELEQTRLADARARVDDLSARLDDALSPTPVVPEFVQLGGAVTAAEERVARVSKLSAADLAPTVDISSAEAELAAARTALDTAIRMLRNDLAASRLDAITTRIAIAEATSKRDELAAAMAAFDVERDDATDVAEITDNLRALGYEGALADQIRQWQVDAGLPVTGSVGPDQLVVASGPAHSATQHAETGDVLSASNADSNAILDYSSVDRLVTVPLPIADQRLAGVGRAVEIVLPDDRRVAGEIAEIGSVVTDGTISVRISIAEQGALADFEVAAVDVEFLSEQREDVLSVPIAALLAQPASGFAVELVNGAKRRLVPVETGLFAAGRVEVAGDGIVEGMLVSVPG